MASMAAITHKADFWWSCSQTSDVGRWQSAASGKCRPATDTGSRSHADGRTSAPSKATDVRELTMSAASFIGTRFASIASGFDSLLAHTIELCASRYQYTAGMPCGRCLKRRCTQ